MSFQHYKEEHLLKMANNWREHNWDLEESIDWSLGIDMSCPFVSLDEHAFLFPGASKEQRLAISQMMGIVIAASIFEMEECLIRIKSECFLKPFSRYPVSPEFLDLGEQFFAEEVKHSTAFKRYYDMFSVGVGVDPDDFLKILPRIHNSKTESFLRFHSNQGGHAFWWIVAIVEQEFLSIYRNLKPNKDILDPLYFRLHHLHFEEEARHAPFPLFMLDFLNETETKPLHLLFKNFDLVCAQVLQSTWTLMSLQKLKSIKRFKGQDPFFDVLISTIPFLEKQNMFKTIYSLITKAPYTSTFLNPAGTQKILKIAKANGRYSLPFPGIQTNTVVDF